MEKDPEMLHQVPPGFVKQVQATLGTVVKLPSCMREIIEKTNELRF